MTTSSITRRAALAGLGAGALGLALAARDLAASAQEASPAATPFPLAGHPVVGVWQWDNDPVGAPGTNISHAIFSDVGGYVEGIWRFRGPEDLVTVGTWRATGDRTADLVYTIQPLVPRDLFDPDQVMEGNTLASPGAAGMSVWRLALTVDEGGNTLTPTGGFEAFDSEGTVIYAQDYVGIGTRMAPVATA